MKLSKEMQQQIKTMFMDKLSEVLKNCADVRADALAKRSITIRLDIKPLGNDEFDLYFTMSAKDAPTTVFCSTQLVRDGKTLSLTDMPLESEAVSVDGLFDSL